MELRSTFRILWLAILGAAPGTPVAAQSMLFAFHGDSSVRELGSGVAPAGDVDGDGIVDLLIAAAAGDQEGDVLVFSGRTGQLIFQVSGDCCCGYGCDRLGFC